MNVVTPAPLECLVTPSTIVNQTQNPTLSSGTPFSETTNPLIGWEVVAWVTLQVNTSANTGGYASASVDMQVPNITFLTTQFEPVP